MPRTVQHTPTWLRQPSPGYNLFSRNAATRKAPHEAIDSFQTSAPPPSRKIAVRDTQVFVASHNELRWADLAQLRSSSEGTHNESHHPLTKSIEEGTAASYRVLKVPVHDEILQLSLSKNPNYLAIATSHTVYIALLPDPYHLSSGDTTSLKLKTYQVGPTTHVKNRSPIASILWHPLGVDGSCLTTITHDATIRLWEFDTQNRMSVNEHALAIDLKRLANGVEAAEDFSPSKTGTVRFSAEMPYLEVSAACYAGQGGSDVERDAGWATTTLWLGMKDGALFALCPLMPSKFAASPKMIDELAATACYDAMDVADNENGYSKEYKRTTADQLAWINGVEKHARGDDFDLNLTVFNRPSQPSAIPMLQGPFRTEPEPDALFDITDMFAVTKSIHDGDPEDAGFLIIDDPSQDERDQVPVNALCIATSDGRVHVCFDLQETSARWLPATKVRSKEGTDDADQTLPELLLLDSIEVDTTPTLGRPMFTADPNARAGVFVTHSQGVTYISLAEIMQKIAEETKGGVEAGGSFRLKLALEQVLATDALIRLPRALLGPGDSSSADTGGAVPSACVALHDSSLGDMVLTEFLGEPFAAVLDYNDVDLIDSEIAGDLDMDGAAADEPAQGQARDTFTIPHELHAQTTLPSLVRRLADKHPRRHLRDPVRITNADMDMMTEAHTVLATETHRINDAVGRLFICTQRLRTEYREQIRRAQQLHERIEQVVDDDDFDGLDGQDEPIAMVDKIDQRVERARARQEELQDRFDALRQQMGKLDRRPLNGKERGWVREVEAIEGAADGLASDDGAPAQNASHRLAQVRELKIQLVSESETAMGQMESGEAAAKAPAGGSGGRRVGSAAIRSMLERERAMVEATRKKLEELMSTRLGE